MGHRHEAISKADHQVRSPMAGTGQWVRHLDPVLLVSLEQCEAKHCVGDIWGGSSFLDGLPPQDPLASPEIGPF